MKTKLWLTALLTVLCCAMFAVGVGAAETYIEGYYTYTVTDGETTITSVNTSVSGAVTIPSTLGGYPVTSIGYKAFEDCQSLTSITIPNSVTSIGDSAFTYCISLTSIAIPNSVTSIGDSAFRYCTKLTSITIPDSVTSIGDGAFWNCLSLRSITIPNSVTYIGEWTFSGCDSLTSITIPNRVTSIGYRAFSSCTSLTSITIPSSVTSIGDSAFSSCDSLTSITIPSSVTSIGNSVFFSCDSLTSITIPSSVTSIGDSVFYKCTSLTSITIPSSVTSIGDEAFWNCDKLTIYGYVGTYAETYANTNSIPFVAVTTAVKPEIYTDITSASYLVGMQASLSAVASVSDGGMLTYQWYVSDTADGAGVAIPGATAAEYMFTATEVGTKYYYLIVTNTNSFGLTASAKSAVRQIIVIPKVDALPPTIFAQTDSLSVPVGESAALFVSASVSDGGTLRYQWYVSDTETGDGTEIPGATDAGYAPPTNTAGVQYYYVIITNTNANATGAQTASVKSAVMELTVGAKKLYTISGSLITYGDAADVTIELLLNGEVIRTVPVADTTGSGTYSIDGVEAGTYTMRISKPKHVTREYEVTVGNP